MASSARQLAVANENRQIDESTARASAAANKPRTALEAMALRLQVSPTTLQNTLKATVFAACRSNEEFVALVVVANEYRLNPLLKEIYAFPTKGGGIQAMVSVDGWIRMTNEHPAYDGIKFIYHNDEKGNTEAIEAIIFRKDRQHPTEILEYMDECKRNTDPWRTSPRRMLRHRALMQCARVAFGFSGIVAEGDVVEGEYSEVPQGAAALPSAQSLAEDLGDEIPTFDRDTGEVRDARGMTEVSEETARELDTGEGEEEQGGPANEMPDDKPVWWDKVQAIRAGFAGAKAIAALKPHAAAFDNIRVGLPDEVIEELDALLVERRKALSGEG